MTAKLKKTKLTQTILKQQLSYKNRNHF